MNTSNVKLSALIGKGLFRIPEYQRPYSWEKDNVDAILDTLEECAKSGTINHFMGAVMIQRNEHNEYEIVDGQQRLTTISLIAKALIDRIETLNVTMDMKKTYLFSLPKILKFKDEYRLTLLATDDINFRKILDSEEANSQSLLTKNYSYIKNKFKSFNENEIANYADVIDELKFIEVELSNEDDPFQIFDTMNSLGMSLSFFDLIKNTMISANESLAKDWQEYFDDKKYNFWREKKNIGASVKAHTEHFLKFYTIVHCSDSQSSEKKKRDQYKNDLQLIKKGDHATKHIKDEFNKLIKYANIYRDIIECSTDEYGDEFRLLANVMNITEQYLFVPVIFKVIIENEKDKAETLGKITNYIVRQFVCSKDTKGLNKHIIPLSEDINKLKNMQDEIKPVSDDEIRSYFNNQISNKRARNVLLLIEQKCQSKGFSFDMTHVSLEHISAVKAHDNINDESKFKIGNMMLLNIKDNIRAGTKIYKDKLKDHYQGWARGMTTYLLNENSNDEWSECSIDDRTNMIINLIIEKYQNPFN